MSRAFLAALAAALMLAPTVAATPNLVLTVQIVPGTLTPGEGALAVVDLSNTGHDALSNVVVTLRLPSELSARGVSGCGQAQGAFVACRLGNIASGSSAKAFVVTRLASGVPRGGQVKLDFFLRVGPGNPPPIASSTSVPVLAASAAGAASCLKAPQTLSATLDQQTTELPSPPSASQSLGLPCTPLAVGVLPKPLLGGYDTAVSTVELPSLRHPASVVLRFPDETLPDEQLIGNLPAHTVASFDNPDPLWVVEPGHPKRVVPSCPAGPKLPVGWQSCVASVRASDSDGDNDSGTITLLVRGSGFGDPRYIG